MLRKNAICILLLLFIFSGCTSRHVLEYGIDYEIRKSAVIELKNNKSFKVNNILIMGDSLVAKHTDTEYMLVIPNDKVQKITVTNRVKGALYGILFSGIPPGTIAYFITENTDEGKGWGFLSFTVFSVLGGAIGSIPGAIIGDKKIYEFEQITGVESHQTKAKTEIRSKYHEMNKEIALKPWKNHIGLSFYFGSKPSRYEYLTAFYYKRYFNLSLINKLLTKPYYEPLYISFSTGQFGGTQEGEERSYYGEMARFKLGLEKYKKGTVKNGWNAFGELGIQMGDMHDGHHYEEGYPSINGLLLSVGMRAWYRALLGEILVNYDTGAKILGPEMIIGFRF
ncbi:MAG: hypothetical protein KAH72_09345 [Flavobacteriaceae bacterium]|nr:hypothetical protein [Flavobacteriaceae bacterium]